MTRKKKPAWRLTRCRCTGLGHSELQGAGFQAQLGNRRASGPFEFLVNRFLANPSKSRLPKSADRLTIRSLNQDKYVACS